MNKHLKATSKSRHFVLNRKSVDNGPGSMLNGWWHTICQNTQNSFVRCFKTEREISRNYGTPDARTTLMKAKFKMERRYLIKYNFKAAIKRLNFQPKLKPYAYVMSEHRPRQIILHAMALSISLCLPILMAIFSLDGRKFETQRQIEKGREREKAPQKQSQSDGKWRWSQGQRDEKRPLFSLINCVIANHKGMNDKT